METLKKRLEEQKEQHHGGNKWIGTGGTSPFGNSGYNPAGVRIGGEGKHGRAIKVWDKREFRNLDNTVELGIRNIKVALRRLRRFAREGAADERSEEHTSELQSLMRISYAVFCLKKKNTTKVTAHNNTQDT